MDFLSYLSSDLQNKAISLSSIGVSRYAWHQEDALQVLSELSKRDFAILGGDILTLQADGTIEYTYDNWFYNRPANASWQDYVVRSNKYARTYIASYTNKINQTIIYNLVIADEEAFNSLPIFPAS